MKFFNTTKLGVAAAALATVLAAAAPASADSYRGYFGDRDGAGIGIVIHDDHRDFGDRDFRDRQELRQREAFFRHARFHHYGWGWQQHDRDFRY